jgi:ATP-dependent Clp protease protease subunit
MSSFREEIEFKTNYIEHKIDWLLGERMKFNKQEHSDNCELGTKSVVPLQLDEIVDDFLIRTRRLLLVGEIDEIASAHICSYLQMFSTNKKPIYLYINSQGGCLASGYAIIDQMLACRCPIYTIVRGLAHSMSAIIAAFGTKGHRYSTPNSSIMLHSVIVQNSPEPIDHHKEMIVYVEEDYHEKVRNLSKKLKLNAKELIELMNKTRWMSPRQAIKIGLIDGIWTPRMEQSINKGLTK